MKQKILIFGTSGQAKVVADIVEKQNQYTIAGFITEPSLASTVGSQFFGYSILGTDRDIESLGVEYGIVALGDNEARSNVVSLIRTALPSFQFATAIHPSAQIAREVLIGEGTVIMAGACINSATSIGAHCIVNTRASVDHDCLIGDFVSINPGAELGGSVKVGSHSMIGIGASVIHGVEIGSHTWIGAGAAVVGSIKSSVVAHGVPCEVIRKR
jgi:sugar O-acyltransferase (sialic acid O-acetyltransferase NeuD family)